MNPNSETDGGLPPSRSAAYQYFMENRILEAFEDAVHDLAKQLPPDPMAHLSSFFRGLSGSASVRDPTSDARPLQQEVFHDSELLEERPFPPTARMEAYQSKLPRSDVDAGFAEYLSGLTSFVRRATT